MKAKIFTLLLAVAVSVEIMNATITVRLDPTSCSDWSEVKLYAWIGESTTLLGSWPGTPVSIDDSGWYSFTFANNDDINIIWNDGASSQTVDINHVVTTTCYALDGMSDGKFTVNVVDCPTGGTSDPAPSAVSGKYRIGELYYNLNGDTKLAEVTSKLNGYYSGSIIIPESVEYNAVTYSVTNIGTYAFRNCTGLTSVTIPNSVTSIGNNAFYGCTSLASVEIPNSVTSIPYNAFYGCSGLTSIEIPNSVTSIGGSAFKGCTSLTSIEIPNSVTSIGSYAFEGCTSLTSVVWNAKNCNNCSFGNQVTSFTFGESVEVVPSGICYGMSQLTSITIPNSVTSIGNYAFEGCTGLTSVTIPNSVTSIGDYAFDGCTGLTSVTIPNSVTSIGDYAFGCTSLTSIEIPNSVTSIEEGAFCNCAGLTSVTIGNSVTSIEYKAFYGCTSLTSIEIPNSVTSIGNYAFGGCTGLTSMTIGNSVTSMGNIAFSSCSKLTDIYATCGDLERVKQMLGNDSRVKNKPLPYTITINAINGKVVSPQTICDALELTAMPNYGYHFIQWSDGITDNPRTIELTKDTTFEAIFTANKYSISVTYDTSRGSVEGPQGEFEYGTELTYEAIPNSNYHFTRWSDGITDNPRTIELTKDTTFEAIFTANKYSISVTYDTSRGSVSGTGTFDYLTECTLEAIPNYGYHFVQWNDGNKDNPRTIELTKDTTFTAVFAPNTYSISLTCDTSRGSVEGPQGEFEYGAELTFTASTKYGYHFDYWGKAISSLTTISVAQAENIAHSLSSGVATTDTHTIEGYITGSFNSLGNSYYISDNLTNSSCVIYDVDLSAIVGKRIKISGVIANYYDYYGVAIILMNDNYYISTNNPLHYTIQSNATLEAIFALNRYNLSALTNPNGSVSGTGTFDYLTECTIEAVPNYGYHFVQWNDGNKDNPRTIVLTQDTIFSAEYAVDKSGKCGDDLALTWEYDATNKVLTISGEGTLNSNYTFGLEAPTAVEKLVIAEGVTTIGNSAFAGYSTLKHLSVAASVKTIYEQAFYNCTGLQQIYCYRQTPPTAYSNTFDGIEKFECVLHVLSASIDMYKAATGWRDFYYVQAIDAEEVTETITDVKVDPQDNAVIVTWPIAEQAATYSLQITKDGVVFCTLIFNANGQLQGIAFAPSKNGYHHAPAAVKTSTGGLRFTVTGLDSGTNYHMAIDAKDSENQVIATYSSDFTTTGVATGIDDVESGIKAQKLIRDNQVLILRGEKTYTVTGQEVK